MFKIGDQVVLLEDYPDNNPDLIIGCTGTVVNANGRSARNLSIGVDWDDFEHGHSCGGTAGCRDGHGWWVRPDQIQLYETREVQDDDIAGEEDIFAFINC